MPTPTQLSRRALLARFAGLTVTGAIGASLLAACGTPAPTASPTTAPAVPNPTTTAPGGQATTATTAPAGQAAPTSKPAAVVSKTGRLALPMSIAPNSPRPDVEGGAITPPGYTRYPATLIRSVADPPARGGEINVVTQTLGTVPPGPDVNPIWQEMNKRIGATLKISITPFADYGAKLPTILASNDMPDMLFLPRGQPVAGFAQFLEAKAADLTPFLSGDGIREYPNLAAHPTGVWRTTVINNKIFGVGDPLAPFFWVHWHHQELLEAAGLGPPRNAADYKKIMATLANPQQGVYGIVAEFGYQYAYGVNNQLFTSIFGAPNQWSLSNGKLTRLFETDQYRRAVEFARDLWVAGLYEPGAAGYNTLSARQAFIARKGVFRWDGNTADIFNSQGVGAGSDQPLGLQPPPKIRLVPPFPAEDGARPTYPLYHGSFGMIVLKKAPDDRIKELLRVLNLLAAPFGTEEREIIAYGLEGRDFTRNEIGAPILTEQGRAENMSQVFNGIVNPPPVYFDPKGGDYVPHVIGVLKQYEAVGVEDPTIGFYSEADSRQGIVANQRFGDGVTDIIAGRRPMSDLPGLIEEWKSNGGDQVRKEYEDAMAAAG
jgi:putative aldouronate transport system substrate-binding protein